MEKYGRGRQASDDNTIRRMRFSHRITKATDTHKHTLRICNNYCFSTATVVARTRLNITFIRVLSILS